MYGAIKQHLAAELKSIEEAGLFKKERIITTPQDAVIKLADGSEVVNFCANNYLGLSSHPRVLEAAKRAIDTHGFGMSSVRFICGTQDIHKELEAKIADFYGTEDTILYAAAFDANGGVFEPLLGEQDAIISDSLNHASIIDGVRLCKAMRFRYENNNMADLETQLIAAREKGARFILVVTDGVFSMDGYVAQLDKICDLAEKYDAMVMTDECHAAGFIGASIEVLNMLNETTALRDKLEANVKRFKAGIKAAGFDIKDGDSAIVPVMLYDAKLSQDMANALLAEGIYVIGFFFPVVPREQARIRVQLSAAHEFEHIDKAVAAFTKVGKSLGVIA
ncbi:MAG: aminotransferase class I/II-fold pyridoxal phosphate-dependent enzyme [Bacteroidetes bacterium]|nr:aminotransferase class I/II-fold pyridoxal phosphate-dependent enzyme [Bacteroidota bacterium]